MVKLHQDLISAINYVRYVLIAMSNIENIKYHVLGVNTKRFKNYANNVKTVKSLI
jgi:hypothetical protein